MTKLRTAPRVTAYACCAALAGCSADAPTTLQELAREGVRAQSALERDVCSCSCGQWICWDFTCSGEGCSSADEYTLVLARDAEPGGGCLDRTSGLGVRLFVENERPLPADRVSASCDELVFHWRGPREGFASRPHRIELADDTDAWSLESPFAPAPIATVALESAPAESATLPAGGTLVLDVSPPTKLAEVHAELRSHVTHEALELAAGEVHDDRVELLLPADTPSGVYDLQLGAHTVLPAEACRGPSVCWGLGLAASFALRVQ